MTTTALHRLGRLALPTSVAGLALAIALSSSATATLLVTGHQIKNGSVTGKDVKDASLSLRDLTPSARPGASDADGLPGAPGARGPQGVPGVSNYVVHENHQFAPARGFITINVSCPPGLRALGGGATWGEATAGGVLVESAPTALDGAGVETSIVHTGYANAWHVEANNNSAANNTLDAWVICAAVG